MALEILGLQLTHLGTPLPVWHAMVTAEAWRAAAQNLASQHVRLVAMWGMERPATDVDYHAVCAAYSTDDGLLWLELPLAKADSGFPDLADLFPCARRMQRAIRDLSGPHADGATDQRPWLDHGLWDQAAPLSAAQGTQPTAKTSADLPMPAAYPFVRVEGDGVHEIAVGPVHAGIIEPGHFRFSVVGEKVLRLEQHLGYVHKGIERRFTELDPLTAHRLAGRVSGDSTVAYAWAYCMALESAWACKLSPRANWLRALLLERERVANHLGDLGALANDVALSFGLTQFARLREDWQRLSQQVFGHRMLMDAIVPGGVALTPDDDQLIAMSRQCDSMAREVRRLKAIYDDHAGLQDRFTGAGRVSPKLAAQLGLCGLAGRASGQAHDLRRDQPWPPYAAWKVAKAVQHSGDVSARVAVRFDEVFESLRLLGNLCSGLPGGASRTELQAPHADCRGAGWVEGWRGEVLVTLVLGADGRIQRCHCHDPSWQNWPVLEHAVIGNIVPDFPLINKSFNLSYSGHDL